MKLNNDNTLLFHFKHVLVKIHFINIELLLYLHQILLNMKNVLLILSLFFLVYSCNKAETLPSNTYEINGSAKGVYNGIRAYLKNVDDIRNEIIIDTAIVMNEAFSFKGKVSNASMRVITINSITGSLPFILEPGKTKIEIYKDSIYYSKIDGTLNNETYNIYRLEYRKKVGALKEINKQIKEARSTKDTTLYKVLIAKSIEKNKELVLFSHDFIEKHPDSDFSLLLLEKMINGTNQDIDKLTNSKAALTDVINRNKANKAIGKKIEDFIFKLESRKNLEIGKIAPNFTSTTPTGKKLSLNDIKGKVTIIDFWAAWCGPCRRENPNIVKVYNKYHEKGLEIIGVSLDGTRRQKDSKAVWLKAIEDDNLTWHQVSSLKYFNDPVAKLYNITSIPASFILDEDGKIVAKKLRGQALEDKIAELLD
jgi:peroxiredoxin